MNTIKKFIPTIGLEIHAELATKSKMFCSCPNNPDEERPNVNICPICMGHPGTLPVLNKEAIRHVLKVGLAVGGSLADFTEWDRKNYFYPDIPKGYQISQYKYPLVEGGAIVAGPAAAAVSITRIHLEEDTAQSTHDASVKNGIEKSLVNFNRAGVPLMELVTEPVIHDAATAVAFAKELQLLLRTLGASEANMEKGEMRVEANVSVASEEDTAVGKFGVKTEVKNLNSFRAVERAIAYEVERQSRILESVGGGEGDNGRRSGGNASTGTSVIFGQLKFGQLKIVQKSGEIIQETRGWDDNAGKTFSQRAKESSHDYRYFPDPDIPKMKLSELSEFSGGSGKIGETLRAELPELPWTLRARLVTDFAMTAKEAAMFVESPPLFDYFKKVMATLGVSSQPSTSAADKKVLRLVINYLLSDYVGLLKKECGEKYIERLATVSPEHFAKLIALVAVGTIHSRGAKDILVILLKNGDNDPEKIAMKKNFIQKNDENALHTIVADIIAAHPTVVADYTKGKTAALQFLIGQGMKASRGSANPELLKKLFIEKISMI
jgi:aspartyl-tRNA(Asn)/glutamyl-tRNA(Gln) amidotransferase subunit B